MMDLIQLHYFHFLRPYWLLAIIPLLIVVVLLLKRKLLSRSWQSVVDARLLPFILIGREARQPKWPVYLLAVAGAVVITAMAGPTWEKLPQPVYRTQSGLVIVLDMSQSMDATDIKPSRISRSKLKIQDILAKRSEGQTALVVYASEAFVVSPLSDDVKTIESMVISLNTGLMPTQGSQPRLAVEKAVELLEHGGMRTGNILLITDGLGGQAYRSVADVLSGKQYRLSVLAVGTAAGAPVQLTDGSLLKDRYGDIVIPKLQAQPLRNLAGSTGGRFTLLTASDKDIDYLSRGFEFSPLKNGVQEDEKNTKQMDLEADRWREEAPWLLLLIAPLAALAFRKGWLGAIALCVLLPLPQASHALGWGELWKNQNQQAQEAFKEGHPQQAAEQFSNTQWQAAAYYKAKNYEKTLELLQNSATPEDVYNKGNALARLGRIQEAIDAYNQVLEKAPGHEDALYNKKMLEKYLKQQQSQNGNSDQQSNQQNDQQNSQKDSQQNDQQSGQQSDQQNQAQQNQDGSQQNQANNSQQQQQAGQQDSKQAQQNENQSQGESASSDDTMSEQQASKANDQQNDQQSTEQNAQTASQSDEQNQQEEAQQQQTAQAAQNVDKAKLEALQANEQWLRRIPDDPGGLLRRKFRYQSQLNEQQGQQPNTSEEPW